MLSAFAVFPNQGVRVRPFEILRVVDRQGNVLEENRPIAEEALRSDTAFVMTHLLRGVVERGTAARAASLKWPLGGKTGTTDDFTDAWFVGFTPEMAAASFIADPDYPFHFAGDWNAPKTNNAVAGMLKRGLEGVPVRDFTPPSGRTVGG